MIETWFGIIELREFTSDCKLFLGKQATLGGTPTTLGMAKFEILAI